MPEASLSQPTTYGPAKPPKFPIELTSAIPAAAVFPQRNSEGSGHNAGLDPYRPIVATDIAAIAQNELPNRPAATSPKAATMPLLEVACLSVTHSISSARRDCEPGHDA